jgi:hypothetical protein
MSETLALLQGSLSVAVPLWVDRIRPNLDEERKHAPDLAQFIGEHGDIILFKSNKKGESADAFNKLARAIALLSFSPGGVTTFGLHFENHANT